MQAALFEKYRRQTVRLEGYDYGADGAYFITICSHKKTPVFSEIRNGEVLLFSLGIIIKEEWEKTATIRDYVTVLDVMVMPTIYTGFYSSIKIRTPASDCRKQVLIYIFLRGIKTVMGHNEKTWRRSSVDLNRQLPGAPKTRACHYPYGKKILRAHYSQRTGIEKGHHVY